MQLVAPVSHTWFGLRWANTKIMTRAPTMVSHRLSMTSRSSVVHAIAVSPAGKPNIPWCASLFGLFVLSGCTSIACSPMTWFSFACCASFSKATSMAVVRVEEHPVMNRRAAKALSVKPFKTLFKTHMSPVPCSRLAKIRLEWQMYTAAFSAGFCLLLSSLDCRQIELMA